MKAIIAFPLLWNSCSLPSIHASDENLVALGTVPKRLGRCMNSKVEDGYSLFVNVHTFQQIPGFSG
jgi:hypothetical protein